MCLRDWRKRGGGGAKETAKGEEEEEGDVHSRQRGMGMEGKREQREEGGGGKRLTGPARTHHPNQLEPLIFPSHNTSPSISDVYNRRGEK